MGGKAKPVAKAPPPPQSRDEDDDYEAEFAPPPKAVAKPATSARAASAPARKITPASAAAPKTRPGNRDKIHHFAIDLDFSNISTLLEENCDNRYLGESHPRELTKN